MSARKEEQEFVVHMKGKGFKKFNQQMSDTIHNLKRLNQQLKKANQLMEQLIDLNEDLEP